MEQDGNLPGEDDEPGAAAAASSPGDLDAIVAGALVALDGVTALEPYLPQLEPGDQERVDRYVGRASAETTLRAYRSDWTLFVEWCAERRYNPLPASPQVAAAFLTDIAAMHHETQTTRIFRT